jgi:hypothetical protein
MLRNRKCRQITRQMGDTLFCVRRLEAAGTRSQDGRATCTRVFRTPPAPFPLNPARRAGKLRHQ